MRIERNPATAPSMNAGAVACEIAELRVSISGTSANSDAPALPERKTQGFVGAPSATGI